MKRPLAPFLPEQPAGTPDPVKEMRDRQKAAIDSRLTDPKRASVAAAGVDGAATPPKATPKQQPSTKAADTPSASPASPVSSTTQDPGQDPPETESTPEKAAEPAAKGPRYELKSFKKWAEQNPEQAAEIGAEVYRVGEDPKQEWIRQQNKARKLKEGLQAAAAAAAAELAAEKAEIKAQADRAEGIANEIRYVAEMWGAANRKNAAGQPDPDFDTIDEAFRQNTGGMSLDDYNRQRARRGVSNPEIAKLKAENARLQRIAAGQAPPAQLPAGKTNGAAGAGTPGNGGAAAAPAPAQPAAPEVDAEALWGGELPKAHPIRRLAGWADELHAEMQKYHDETLDEYSRDPEDVAQVVLKRMLKGFEPEEEETPALRAAAKGKPNTPKNRKGKTAFSDEPAEEVTALAKSLAPRGKVNEDRSHTPTTLDEINGFDGGLAARERRAMERHKLRLAGKLAE